VAVVVVVVATILPTTIHHGKIPGRFDLDLDDGWHGTVI